MFRKTLRRWGFPRVRAFIPVVLIFPMLAACGGRTAHNMPTPNPNPHPVEVDPADFPAGGGEAARALTAVVETALQAIGTPYEWGGTAGDGFDCSGLIQYAYRQHGIQLPRVSQDQLQEGSYVIPRIAALLPGDILGFSGKVGGKSTHVGLYVGNGEFIHSSSSGVRVSNLSNPYWQQYFIAARRIVQ